MINTHLILGEDSNAMKRLALSLRKQDPSIEIKQQFAKTFAAVERVGAVHVIGDFPHIAQAYREHEWQNGGDTVKPEVFVSDEGDEAEEYEPDITPVEDIIANTGAPTEAIVSGDGTGEALPPASDAPDAPARTAPAKPAKAPKAKKAKAE